MSVMPSPDWNGVEVRWRGHLIDGTPAAGHIEFAAAASRFLDDDPAAPLLVLGSPIKATIADGVATVTLPATDDPDITPSGFTYRVTERLSNASGATYSIEVPLSEAATGIELARVSPVPSSPGEPTSLYVRLSTGPIPPANPSVDEVWIDTSGA